MKKALFIIFVAIVCLQHVTAATHVVLVGQGNGFTFSPSTLNVIVGDIVRFEWVTGNHTTTSVTVPSGAATWSSTMSASVTSFDYTVTTAGTYDYKCNPHGGSGMTGSFTASTTTGIVKSNLFTPETVTLSPNPATTNTNITITVDQHFKGDVKIFSAQGVLVSDFPIKLNVGINVISLNTDAYSNGLYYVNISDKRDALYVTKLVVSK
jgi:plastocyanin